MIPNLPPSALYNLDIADRSLSCGDQHFLLNGLAIVVSPHQDDESIGMGGTIAKMRLAGYDVHIIFTTIEKFAPQQRLNPQKRKLEAGAALQQLLVNSDKIKYIDLNDGDTRTSVLSFANSAGFLKDLIRKIEMDAGVTTSQGLKRVPGETLVLTTSRHDAHRDHEETFNMVKNGLRKHIILEFPVVNHMSSQFQPNCFIDITNASPVKIQALKKYQGEIAKNRILWEDIAALEADYGAACGADKAEACYISWFGYIPSYALKTKTTI